MNNFKRNLEICIDEKIVNECMENGISLLDYEILYHNNIRKVSLLFTNPQDYYTKILSIAYKQTKKQTMRWY